MATERLVSKIKESKRQEYFQEKMSSLVRPRPKTSRQNPVRKSYGAAEPVGALLAKAKIGSRSGVHFRNESDGYAQEMRERSLLAYKYPGMSPVRASYERDRIARKKKQQSVTMSPQSPRHKKNLTAVFRHQDEDEQFSAVKKSLMGVARPRKKHALDTTPASMSYIYKNPRLDSPRVKRRFEELSFDNRLTREFSNDLEEDKGRIEMEGKRQSKSSHLTPKGVAAMKHTNHLYRDQQHHPSSSFHPPTQPEPVRRKFNNYMSFEETKRTAPQVYSADNFIIPQNVVTRFSYSTKAGVVPHNPYKVNQDQYIVTPKMLGRKYLHLFGICDGHGQLGREASYTAKIRLISNMESELRVLGAGSPHSHISLTQLKRGIRKAYIQTNTDVVKASFDTNFSGTTCCNIIFAGRKGFCANVGDSRAVIASLSQSSGEVVSRGSYVARAISRDHKPSEKDEQSRVIRAGGRVQQYRDPLTHELLGPLRVWARTQEYPGLAMTRSIGDEVAKRLGVSAEPEIHEISFCEADRFVIIGSDGVWQFMSNQQAVNIVASFFEKQNAEGAAQSLVRDALRRWRSREDVVDDITCVILFLDVPPEEPQGKQH